MIVNRTTIDVYSSSPPFFKSNIAIPVLPAKHHRFYFLPDRILVWGRNGVGAVGYAEMEVAFGEQQFIEDGDVPNDTRVVDKTWRYVNKKGGPDKRFSDNREIPIVVYEALILASKSGVKELYQVSRTGVGAQLEASIKRMAVAITQPGPTTAEQGFLKCPCNNCDILIEFPAHGLGQTITCPHCGIDTVLFEPGASN